MKETRCKGTVPENNGTLTSYGCQVLIIFARNNIIGDEFVQNVVYAV